VNDVAILDLQGMKSPATDKAGRSGASKDCFNVGGGHSSRLSLLLC
jgi:hypothetical protein